MHPHGEAPVAAGAQQDAAPEVVELRQVVSKVDVGKIHEYRLEQRVGQGASVEAVDQQLDVGFGGDVGHEAVKRRDAPLLSDGFG